MDSFALTASVTEPDARHSTELLARRKQAEDAPPRPLPLVAIPDDARAVLELADAREEIGLARMLHAVGALTAPELQTILAGASGRIGVALRLLTGAGLVALLAVGVSVVTGPAPRAAATTVAAPAVEGAQPDPGVTAPAVVRVSLAGPVTTVRVPVRTATRDRYGRWCAVVYGPWSVLGRACSTTPRYSVPVTLGRWTPVGRMPVSVVDAVEPWTGLPVDVTLDIRRATRFGRGYYEDRGLGNMVARIPVTHYSPLLGRWVPSQGSPVLIQERVLGRWVTRATLYTDGTGIAYGTIEMGGGVHVYRAVRPAGASVWGAVGTTRVIDLLTEPIDIV